MAIIVPFLCRGPMMHRHNLLPIALLWGATLHAQIPIAEARDLPLGTVVTVRGIVLNGGELGGIRYVQDATGGIAAFPGTGSISGFNPPRGADLSVTGPLKLFNGLLEIDPVQAFTVHSTNNPLPAPQPITPSGMGEINESELVRMNGCSFVSGGTFSSGTRPFTCNGESGVIFLRSQHPLVGTPVPVGALDLVGIVSQFSSAPVPVGGYQLLPRDAADLIPSTSIALVGEVAQTDIVPNGFTLRWNTNLSGTSRVRYGATPALGSFAGTGSGTTTHAVALTGLPPAAMVYAQPFSVQGTDTAFAPVGLYSTASAEPGSITVYFNRSVDVSVATGPPAINLGSALDDTLIAYIDRAQYTLDVAVYNTTSNAMVSAVNAAHARGVQVRWTTEASQGNSALNNLHPAIPVLQRQNSSGSGMHNKFLVIDADHGPLAHVITGSANLTNGSLFFDANNVVIVRDQALARGYRREFEEMWGGSGPQPVPANSRFGSGKQDDTPHFFNVGGTPVQLWFSPSDGTTARIAKALRTADQRIEFALFVLSSSTLTEELIDAQALPSVTVRGVLEEDDLNGTSWNALLAGGVQVLTDGAAFSLHHKYAIVDRDAPQHDPQVVTGSHNWSFNAENHNDENTLIIHSAEVANLFYQEWAARWTTAVGIDEAVVADRGLHLWPNPATDLLVIDRAAGSGPAELLVSDATGRQLVRTVAVAQRTLLAVEHLPAGLYLVNVVERDGRRASGRFVRGH
jgi:phosphatidylserine/phosphatidylglycerophosphate/cardiolipin synthase-like enzyme